MTKSELQCKTNFKLYVGDFQLFFKKIINSLFFVEKSSENY